VDSKDYDLNTKREGRLSVFQEFTQSRRLYKATTLFKQLEQQLVHSQKKMNILEQKSISAKRSVLHSLHLCNASDKYHILKSRCDHMQRFIAKSR
jgi:hypothetical protein